MANTPEFRRSHLWTVFDHRLPGMVMEILTELCIGQGWGLVGWGIWASSVCSVAPGKHSMRKNESRKGIQNLPWPRCPETSIGEQSRRVSNAGSRSSAALARRCREVGELQRLGDKRPEAHRGTTAPHLAGSLQGALVALITAVMA